MNIDIKEFYDTYLKRLGWREKLELIELLMQATLESVREEKEPLPSAQKTEEQLPNTSENESHTDLQKKLLEQLEKNSAFWSYDLGEQGGANIPDELLIEQTLLQGDVEQLFLLFELFPETQIRTVWENKLVPHEKYRSINHYLGLFFFQIKEISSFLNQRIVAHPRLERLKLLAAED